MALLIQMAGFPGSGKSTLAKIIGTKIGAVVLDRDIIKNSMLVSSVNDDILARTSYNVVYDLAAFYLGLEQNVIIDTPCLHKETIDNGSRLCIENKAQYKYIECIVEDYEIISKRLSVRDSLETQIKAVTEEKYYAYYDKSVKPDDVPSLTLDTTDIKTLNIEEIVDYLLTPSVSNVGGMNFS